MADSEQYRVTFVRSARRDLEALDPPIAKRVLPKIEALADDPQPPGCAKIAGSTNLWRIRVGDWRVIYAVDHEDFLVEVRTVRHRRDAYR